MELIRGWSFILAPCCPGLRPQINEFVKRVRACKIHMLIVGHLRKQMPTMFGREKAQKKLLDDIVAQFQAVQRCVLSYDGRPQGHIALSVLKREAFAGLQDPACCIVFWVRGGGGALPGDHCCIISRNRACPRLPEAHGACGPTPRRAGCLLAPLPYLCAACYALLCVRVCVCA